MARWHITEAHHIPPGMPKPWSVIHPDQSAGQYGTLVHHLDPPYSVWLVWVCWTSQKHSSLSVALWHTVHDWDPPSAAWFGWIFWNSALLLKWVMLSQLVTLQLKVSGILHLISYKSTQRDSFNFIQINILFHPKKSSAKFFIYLLTWRTSLDHTVFYGRGSSTEPTILSQDFWFGYGTALTKLIPVSGDGTMAHYWGPPYSTWYA